MALETPWWDEKENITDSVGATFSALYESLKQKTQEDMDNLWLYGGRRIDVDDLSLVNPGSKEITHKYNISQSIIDTLNSKIGKMKPRPFAMPSGGEWETKAKAQKINKTILGQFDALDIYAKGRRCFRNACINGSSFAKVYSVDGKIQIDPVMSHEILCDWNEGAHGNPRQLFQTKLYPLEVCKAEYPESAKEIEMSKVSADGGKVEYVTDMVKVVEAWHLKSGEEAEDGRHVIFVAGSNIVLFDEEWKRDGFPFAHLQYLVRPIGYFGQGIAEIVRPLQHELNYFLEHITEIVKDVDRPFWTVSRGSNIDEDVLRAQVTGRIVEHDGQMGPQLQSNSGISGELFAHVQYVWEKAFELLGLSQLSAASIKPKGLDSGVALRNMQDIESERFQELGLQFQDFFLDIAKLIIKELSEMPDIETVVEEGDYLDKIKWGDISLEEDMYSLRLYPISSLPSTPEGKLQVVSEYMNAGFIDRDAALDLLDIPDVEGYMNLEFAGRKLIEKNISKMLLEGEYGINERPDPFDNLEYALDYSKKMYQKSRLDGAEPDRMELLSRYISDVITLITASQPPPVPPPMPQPGMAPPGLPPGASPLGPIAQGMPPPTSDMLPFQ